MNNRIPRGPSSLANSSRRSRLPWFIAAGCLLVVFIALLFTKNKNPITPFTSTDAPQPQPSASPNTSVSDRPFSRLPNPRSFVEPAFTAAEIVTNKVTQFARSRRKLAHAMAEHFKIAVPNEFERFFDAAEAGRYDEMTAIYQSLRRQRETGTDTSWYGPQWRTIIETQGVADAARDWPAQKLLDYGNDVLGSLRPGMVYVGGTDPGCFIPTLLNETSDGDRHIVLTQNALADDSYLDYLSFLYGDRMKTLTKDDSQFAFQEYIADAQKRLQHDQQFPTEPKQVRPGEDIRIGDNNKVQVSGQVAVMAINEKLLQIFMQNNPNASFAMEESFPFASTYAKATPLGPIMELGVQHEQDALTAERAAQSVDYWRATAQQLLSDPETPEGSDPRKAYSKMVSAQAGLFLAGNYTAEAEQAFRIANEICPTSPEAVFRYVNMLVEQQRFQDAILVGENAVNAAPENRGFGDLLVQLKKMKPK